MVGRCARNRTRATASHQRAAVDRAVLTLEPVRMDVSRTDGQRSPCLDGPPSVLRFRRVLGARDFTANRPIEASHRRWVHAALRERRQEAPAGHTDTIRCADRRHERIRVSPDVRPCDGPAIHASRRGTPIRGELDRLGSSAATAHALRLHSAGMCPARPA